MSIRPDPDELRAAIEMLRSIYWREYGRGWKDAVQSVKEILERHQPPTDTGSVT